MINSIDWPMIIVACTCALLALALIQQRIAVQQLKKEIREKEDELKKELRGVTDSSIGVGKRLLRFDSEFRHLVTRVDEIMRDDPNRVSYYEASRLVSLGAEIEDLVSSCGLSRPEAELMQAVYQGQVRQ